MKTAISGFGLIVMLVIAITCQSMIINYSSRQEELSTAVNAAMYETQKALRENTEDIRSESDYVNVFMTNLLGEGRTNAKYDSNGNYKQNGYISSNSNISLKVYTADYENGFLDVAVTETYGYNNTDNTVSKRKVTVRRSSIIEYETKKNENKPNTGGKTQAIIIINYNCNDNDVQFITNGVYYDENRNQITDPNSYIPNEIDPNEVSDITIKIPMKVNGNIDKLKVSISTQATGAETTVNSTVQDVTDPIAKNNYDKILIINVKDIQGDITLTITN